MASEIERQFREAIVAAGLPPPDRIIADGKLHRYSTNGQRSDDAGWYVLHADGPPAGAFGDWRTGVWQQWRADIGRKLSPAEEIEVKRRYGEVRRLAEADRQAKAARAAALAAEVWAAARPAGADHPYLVRKGVRPTATLRELPIAELAVRIGYCPKSDGEPLEGRILIAPVRFGGRLTTLEMIDERGRKSALAGGLKGGGYWTTAPLPDAGRLVIAEGVATALSIAEALGEPVAAALSAHNLLAVGEAIRKAHPEVELVIAADLDKGSSAPFHKAVEAATALRCGLAVPDLGDDRPECASDFNDLHQARGLEAVRRAVEAAQPVVGSDYSPNVEAPSWPKPQPLTARIEPEPYPLDALPDTVREAVEEVTSFVKCPISLAATSALSAISIACQALVDVRRADRLQGPMSLYTLVIADSGERKTTVDRYFTEAIRQYEAEQREALAPEIKRYEAEIAAWQAQRDGILYAIKNAAKSGKQREKLETLKAELVGLERTRPESPRIPRLLLGDETPENLAWSLAKVWPSGGVLSSEAAVVLGAHGMGRDSIMRNLGFLNVLWDGGVHSIGRRTSESFVVRGARLTVGLMVQEATLRDFFLRSGELARGTGFLARFLIAWPQSTQGYRFYAEPPKEWPALSAFNRCMSDILNNSAPIDGDGALTPEVLPLSPAAKKAWIEYHDAIEAELRDGGEYYDVRDVAAKSAENAARLAALFQMFEHGVSEITLDCFERASIIAAWHLHEARRFFGELALPPEMVDAARLDTWLTEYCRREGVTSVGKNTARQYGPLRDGARLDAAIRELASLDRLQLVKSGKRLDCATPFL